MKQNHHLPLNLEKNRKSFKKEVPFFPYGTQYYRAPTPLPEEWEYDLKNMEKAGLDTIQLRVQWKWNEPAEGKYLFDDVDRLFDLAQKYQKKVIFKFLMECAPDYIFYKYQGHRKDMFGLPLHPGAHGAYYVGGWWPCFDNPDVVKKAEDFVRASVERYKKKKNLILWNIWNEPRSRPIGECGCEHSIKAYRLWLKGEFQTIARLNKMFGKRWEGFDTVMPPTMPADYAELFLWRRWSLFAVKRRLEFMYKAVKEVDESRPIICHVGSCSVVQDVGGDGSDDVENSKVVDFYGTSFPTATHFTNLIDESQPFMICDWLRSVSEYYWVCELYPDWGNWHRTVTRGDFLLKAWSTIACGCKGLLYWQYRAERLGNESNLSGLVNIDGSFKEVTYESEKVSRFIRKHQDFLMNARVKEDAIGILYSLESDLISRIENTGGDTMWSFDLKGGYPYLYKKALSGIYSLFRELGFTIKWIDTRKLQENLRSVNLLYIPECFMVSRETTKLVEDFLRKGGYVIAEEGIGLRKENTWVHSRWPGGRIGGFCGAKISERVSSEIEKDSLTMWEHAIPAGGYISYLESKGGKPIGCWKDGRLGAVQKGNLFYLGTSLGASFYGNYLKDYTAYTEILSQILKKAGVELPRTVGKGLYTRELVSGDRTMVFLFNRTGSEQRITFEKGTKEIECLTESLTIKSTAKGIQLKVLPHQVGIYLR